MGALAAIALVLVGCGDDDILQRQPVAPDDGIAVTGRFAGRTVSVSDGAPEVLVGDCDIQDGRDRDLCIVTRTIDGGRFTLVVENPAVLEQGAEVRVAHDGCGACDDLTDHAVVDVRVGDSSARAVGGRLRVTAGGPRYSAQFRLRFPDGSRISGRFNVAPAPVPP